MSDERLFQKIALLLSQRRAQADVADFAHRRRQAKLRINLRLCAAQGGSSAGTEYFIAQCRSIAEWTGARITLTGEHS